MGGVALEFVISILLLLIFVPIAIVAMIAIESLDPEDSQRTTSGQRAEGRTWPQRIWASLPWTVAGLLIAALIGFAIDDRLVWLALGAYVPANLIGTHMMLSEAELGPRGLRTVRALFVEQVPLGVLVFVANGM